MAFRADETKKDGYEHAMSYLVPQGLKDEERISCQDIVSDIIDKCGHVIEGYPSWHPLVSANQDDRSPITVPEKRGGYNGLDHTIYFVNGFITCPYHDEQKVIDSVKNLPENPVASIKFERIDTELYGSGTKPVLVYCEWETPLPMDGMIPKHIAIPLMLEQEVPYWRESTRAETWETMRPYFLGRPYGSRSSLFVNQETGLVLKKVWNALIYTGMFGPIKV